MSDYDDYDNDMLEEEDLEEDEVDFSDNEDMPDSSDAEFPETHELDDYHSGDEIDNNSFIEVIPERDIRKIYEVDFKVHSTQSIAQFQAKEITHVSNILGCLPEHAGTLLRAYKWNKEKLLESYVDNPEKVCDSAGVIIDEKKKPKVVEVKGFMCDICCNDAPGLKTLALHCGHRFCVECFGHYLTEKIARNGESRKIQCMQKNCSVIVDQNTIQMLVNDEVYKKYQNLLIRTYVDDNSKYRWCPAPNCEFAVECSVPQTALQEITPTVTCSCEQVFCHGCGFDGDHQPAICELVKLWLKKCADDSETANWIHANTKECPKCQSTIEKNGGCNHMTCKKCKYEFCWVCLGPWSDHGTSWYNCNRYDEKAGVEARDQQTRSRQALEKYLFYYNRYANHEQSAKLDKELYMKTEVKMNAIQNNTSLSWIEVQFLQKAVNVLVEARQTLKWTYAFAYYLKRDNTAEIFEDNQRDLEMAVEALSGLCERPIEGEEISSFKLSVLDKTQYVKSRKEVLLVDTCKGLIDRRWEFNVPLRNV